MAIKKGLYRHFKGQFYRVIEQAKHSETEEELVIYQALYAERGIWARPLAMFTERVVHEGVEQDRFTYCEDQNQDHL